MTTYKINLVGGGYHIIQSDKDNITDLVKLIFGNSNTINSVITFNLHSFNAIKQNGVAIVSNKVVSVEYYKED